MRREERLGASFTDHLGRFVVVESVLRAGGWRESLLFRRLGSEQFACAVGSDHLGRLVVEVDRRLSAYGLRFWRRRLARAILRQRGRLFVVLLVPVRLDLDGIGLRRPVVRFWDGALRVDAGAARP